MSRSRSWLVALAIASTYAALSRAEDAESGRVEIPLKDIWALNMPGTKDIREHDSPDAEKSVVMKALQQVRESWDHDPGMAVQGEALTAIDEFYRIRTGKLQRNEVLADSPVSLVFYTTVIGFYTHVQRVERHGDSITIQYRFEPHRTQDMSQHLAVIPIGKVPPGKYEVKVEQLQLDKQDIDHGYEKLLPRQVDRVCKSFSFLVREPEVQQ